MGVSLSRYVALRKSITATKETVETIEETLARVESDGALEETVAKDDLVLVDIDKPSPVLPRKRRKKHSRDRSETSLLDSALAATKKDDDKELEKLAEQYMVKLAKDKVNKRRNKRKQRANLTLDTDNLHDDLQNVPVVAMLFGDDEDELVDDGYYTMREKTMIEKPRPKPKNTNDAITWRRGEKLGEGAFGSVFLALNEDTGELIGVKQINLSTDRTNRTEDVLTGLNNEISVMASLQNDNIVNYLGSETTDKHLNIFLEYVPGGSIRDVLKKFGTLNEKLVRNYTGQILKGLAYLHSHQIMHRDIKGANILVTTQSVCKLADFGASTRLADLTLEGRKSVHGTPYWMAPEVIKQTGHGRQADIWSVGCTVIEMLTGLPPWNEYKTAVSAMFHIATTEEYPPLPEGLSDEGIDFLKLCFTRDPKLRPNSLKLLNHPFITQPYEKSGANSVRSSGRRSGRKTSSSTHVPVEYIPTLNSPSVYDNAPQYSPVPDYTIPSQNPYPPKSTPQYGHKLDVKRAYQAEEDLVSTYLNQRTMQQIDRVRSTDEDIYKSYQSFNAKSIRKSSNNGGSGYSGRKKHAFDDMPVTSTIALENKQKLLTSQTLKMTEKERQQAQWELELQEELNYQKSLAMNSNKVTIHDSPVDTGRSVFEIS